MKFENIDGVQHIILEENDKISLKTEDAFASGSINVECENGCLNISGDSLLINKISGEGMLEKLFFLLK